MRFLALLFALLPFWACTHTEVPPTPMAAPSVSAATISFLSLGDSYTIGEGVSEQARWSVQLAQQLRQRSTEVAPPDLIARTGWTTQDLQRAIVASGNQRTYELVSLLIGVNDQYQGQSAADYRPRLRQLLLTATRFAGGRSGRVVVLSIPDWGQTPYAQGRNRTQIGEEIDQFNEVARQECQQVGVAFVDITGLTRSASGDASQFAPDGLHYSGQQMATWAEAALPVVQKVVTVSAK
ncbi:SGNH/GDSL hydrolase family protein [Hymenobacter sp. NBH84]|uniref:SGNH/GDSL hydrolase family protein n=1 Tax=Hymenobacter sp. NBH84 TaxID=2596915 RepID=UPI001626C94D|nr:GDSL-type esterase/lipase family protein [Hymenobacter sp. NBH84]QNE40512.1 SGNH/GDSL hydrolase family protein [Hymenobacter sp. NBH84]